MASMRISGLYVKMCIKKWIGQGFLGSPLSPGGRGEDRPAPDARVRKVAKLRFILSSRRLLEVEIPFEPRWKTRHRRVRV